MSLTQKEDSGEEIVKETGTSTDEEASIPYNPEAHSMSYWRAMIAVVAGGCAFMSDGYQQGVLTPINLVLSMTYKGYTADYKTMVSNSNLVANVIGQIFFGVFVDRIGRKQSFTITTSFIILGSILAACAKGSTEHKLFWMLVIARGIGGVGIGGEYPTSAASSMEAAEERLAGDKKLVPFIFSTNFPIALGLPFATCVFLIFEEIWGVSRYVAVWRSCFAFGAIFPIIIFYFRWKMDHAKMFKQNAIKSHVPYTLIFKRYWKDTLGVAGMWFIMDFVIYPNNIFSSSVITVVIPGASIKKTAEWLLLLGSFALFGCVAGMVMLRWFSRRQIIIMGFAAYGVLSVVLGAAFEKISRIPALFIVFYAMMNAVMYAGPANIQSVVASEAFATAVRGTLYGFCAAVGKAGAAIGTEIFTPIQIHAGKKYTFIVSGVLSLLGAVFTYFFVPDTSKYNLAEKDREFNEYLLANGWNGFVGEQQNKHKIDGDAE